MALFDEAGNGGPPDSLSVLRSYLAMAIQIGAPAYNGGDHRGCYDVYACTARLLLHSVKGAEDYKRLLREALQNCSTVPDVNQQAWIMRHAFDAILDTNNN
jgi:hypothetical protein